MPSHGHRGEDAQGIRDSGVDRSADGSTDAQEKKFFSVGPRSVDAAQRRQSSTCARVGSAAWLRFVSNVRSWPQDLQRTAYSARPQIAVSRTVQRAQPLLGAPSFHSASPPISKIRSINAPNRSGSTPPCSSTSSPYDASTSTRVRRSRDLLALAERR